MRCVVLFTLPPTVWECVVRESDSSSYDRLWCHHDRDHVQRPTAAAWQEASLHASFLFRNIPQQRKLGGIIHIKVNMKQSLQTARAQTVFPVYFMFVLIWSISLSSFFFCTVFFFSSSAINHESKVSCHPNLLKLILEKSSMVFPAGVTESKRLLLQAGFVEMNEDKHINVNFPPRCPFTSSHSIINFNVQFECELLKLC